MVAARSCNWEADIFDLSHNVVVLPGKPECGPGRNALSNLLARVKEAHD
jgi:hypothetical protein